MIVKFGSILKEQKQNREEDESLLVDDIDFKSIVISHQSHQSLEMKIALHP